MQDIFTKGMNKWFALKEFQVGVPTEDIDQKTSFEDFVSRIDKVGLLSTTIGRALGSLPHAHRVGGFAAKTGKLCPREWLTSWISRLSPKSSTKITCTAF